MVKTKTEQAIIDALEAVAPQHDVDIVDVELVGATKAPCVRVRIEGAEGQSLSLNDVTANTKWVGDVIEELDPISSSYTLEVSSPGMARPLRRPCDFARFVGENLQCLCDSSVPVCDVCCFPDHGKRFCCRLERFV